MVEVHSVTARELHRLASIQGVKVHEHAGRLLDGLVREALAVRVALADSTERTTP
jgi:hypothetical protein